MASRQPTCDEVRAQIAAMREGWLPSEECERLRRHLRECPLCAAEVHRDDRLVAALASLTPAPVAAPEWTDVLRRSSGRRHRRAMAPILATCAAAAALAIVFLHHPVAPTHPVGPPRPAPAQTALLDNDLQAAHVLVSAGDASADPNRAVLLLAARRSADGRR